MKDLVISAKFIRREILMLVLSLLLALAINVYAIIAFKTQWSELLTTWHITLLLALALYVLLIVPRICWAVLRRLFRPKHRTQTSGCGVGVEQLKSSSRYPFFPGE